MSSSLPWQPGPDTPLEDVGWMDYGGGEFWTYAEGFRRGAELLLDRMRAGEPADFLVYPTVYLARHAVELMLKQVIREGRRLIEDPGDFPDRHQLDLLWATCKPVLKRIWPSSTFAEVEITIERLKQIDPNGEGFRYPVASKKAGQRTPTLPSDLERLDLGALVADVVEAIETLDGADTGIDVYLEYKREVNLERQQIADEIRAEYRDYDY